MNTPEDILSASAEIPILPMVETYAAMTPDECKNRHRQQLDVWRDAIGAHLPIGPWPKPGPDTTKGELPGLRATLRAGWPTERIMRFGLTVISPDEEGAFMARHWEDVTAVLIEQGWARSDGWIHQVVCAVWDPEAEESKLLVTIVDEQAMVEAEEAAIADDQQADDALAQLARIDETLQQMNKMVVEMARRQA